MKKSFWIILTAVALLIISFFVGYDHLEEHPENPISVSLAESAAKQYISSNLPGTEYEITSVGYFDKDDLYYVTIACPGSQDKRFTLGINHIGTITRDNYEYYVLNKASTAIRINEEYNAAVKEILISIPGTTEFFCTGNLQWKTSDISAITPNYFLSNDLELDCQYAPSDFGAQAGYIWFRATVDSEQSVNSETMAELLLYVREQLDAAGIPFAGISATLQCEESYTSIKIGTLQYADIVPEGLEGRIVEALI